LVVLSIAESKLVLHVRDADKLWALKSSLEIPLIHIAGVRAHPEAASGWSPRRDDPSEDVPPRGSFRSLEESSAIGGSRSTEQLRSLFPIWLWHGAGLWRGSGLVPSCR
jgi:hypothetical protein